MTDDNSPLGISILSETVPHRWRSSNMVPSLLQQYSEYYNVKLSFVLAVFIALMLCIARSVDSSHRSLSSCFPD